MSCPYRFRILRQLAPVFLGDLGVLGGKSPSCPLCLGGETKLGEPPARPYRFLTLRRPVHSDCSYLGDLDGLDGKSPLCSLCLCGEIMAPIVIPHNLLKITLQQS